MSDESFEIQREWVLPVSLAERWSLKQFSWVFDGLPARDSIKISKESSDGEASGLEFTWQDNKRVLLGMLAHNGMGGDGTISYYIMQEGEVKPRQNG